LNERLGRHERVALGTIGTFYIDRQSLAFEPSGHNFLTDTLGMSPLALPVSPRRAGDTREYVHVGSSLMARLFKYGLSAAVITGIIIISQQEIFRPGPHTNSAAMQHAAPLQERPTATPPAIISPAHDFVDYTPSF
jgi:hypothetical protein